MQKLGNGYTISRVSKLTGVLIYIATWLITWVKTKDRDGETLANCLAPVSMLGNL